MFHAPLRKQFAQPACFSGRQTPFARSRLRPRANSKSKDSAAQQPCPRQSMRAHAPAGSFVDTMPASFGFSLQAKLRVIVRQNPRRSHIKLKRSQLRVLLDLVDELVSKRSRVRLPVYGNLTRRLII